MIYLQGDICPQSGIYQNVSTGNEIVVVKGNPFPSMFNSNYRYKLVGKNITNVSEFLEWVNSNSDITKEIKDREQEYLKWHTRYNTPNGYELGKWFEDQLEELSAIYEISTSDINDLFLYRDKLEKELRKQYLKQELDEKESKDEEYYSFMLEESYEIEDMLNEIENHRHTIIKNELYTKEAIKEYFKHKYLQETKNISVFFRGHADIQWKLLPSIFRDKHLDYESIMYERALRDRPNEFTSPDILDNLVHMQHHGLPTRLLDITSNPLVALYFACDTSNALAEIDGRVFLFIEQSFYNFEHSKLFSNFVLLPDEKPITSDPLFNNGKTILDLLSIDKDKPIPRILLEDKTLYKPSKNNARLIAQSGEFYIYGHSILNSNSSFYHINKKVQVQVEDRDKEIELPIFSKNNYINSKEPPSVFISAEHKVSILKELDQLNINQSSLFPDLDNYCSYIKSKYK